MGDGWPFHAAFSILTCFQIKKDAVKAPQTADKVLAFGGDF